MTYTIHHTDKYTLVHTVHEKDIDRTFDIALFGRKRLEYGEDMNENMVHLLEHFSCPQSTRASSNVVPNLSLASKMTRVARTYIEKPTDGQLWYNSTQERLFSWHATVSRWLPLGMTDDIAANWGTIAHGEYLPKPVSTNTGYIFDYDECSWVVTPFDYPSEVSYMSCHTTVDAQVVSQYSGDSGLVNGNATFLIVGIRDSVNGGGVVPIPLPSLTPTPTYTPTPSTTESGIPAPSASAPPPTPTPTISYSATEGTIPPTPTPTVSYSSTGTPVYRWKACQTQVEDSECRLAADYSDYWLGGTPVVAGNVCTIGSLSRQFYTSTPCVESPTGPCLGDYKEISTIFICVPEGGPTYPAGCPIWTDVPEKCTGITPTPTPTATQTPTPTPTSTVTPTPSTTPPPGTYMWVHAPNTGTCETQVCNDGPTDPVTDCNAGTLGNVVISAVGDWCEIGGCTGAQTWKGTYKSTCTLL